jgi:calcium-dependent protein kinase
MGCGVSSQLDNYSREKKLGEGFSCIVTRVKDKKTGQLYALKELKKKHRGSINLGMKELWESEAAVLSLVKGPHIIELVDSFENPDVYCILTKLATGGELFDKIYTNGSFSERNAAHLTYEMLTAISYCHSQGVVHRDIKPENFVFENKTEQSKMVLIDFGCALVVNDTEVITDTIGSPYYIAPEVLSESFKRTGKTWKASDMWSIGVVAYLLLTGQAPFNGDSEAKMNKTIRAGKYEYPSDSKISANAKDFIDKLLVLDVKKRLTANQALQHPWIMSPLAASDVPLPEQVMQGLAEFKKAGKLKSAVGNVMLTRLAGAERRAWLSAFLEFDTDGDGVLMVEEVQKMMFKVGKTDQKDIDRLLSVLDSDGSGTITQDEFVAAAMASQLSSASEAELKQSFALFDYDLDGKISKEELKRIFPALKPEKIDELVAEADTDGDGQISFEEWIAIMRK